MLSKARLAHHRPCLERNTSIGDCPEDRNSWIFRRMLNSPSLEFASQFQKSGSTQWQNNRRQRERDRPSRKERRSTDNLSEIVQKPTPPRRQIGIAPVIPIARISKTPNEHDPQVDSELVAYREQPGSTTSATSLSLPYYLCGGNLVSPGPFSPSLLSLLIFCHQTQTDKSGLLTPVLHHRTNPNASPRLVSPRLVSRRPHRFEPYLGTYR